MIETGSFIAAGMSMVGIFCQGVNIATAAMNFCNRIVQDVERQITGTLQSAHVTETDEPQFPGVIDAQFPPTLGEFPSHVVAPQNTEILELRTLITSSTACLQEAIQFEADRIIQKLEQDKMEELMSRLNNLNMLLQLQEREQLFRYVMTVQESVDYAENRYKENKAHWFLPYITGKAMVVATLTYLRKKPVDPAQELQVMIEKTTRQILDEVARTLIHSGKTLPWDIVREVLEGQEGSLERILHYLPLERAPRKPTLQQDQIVTGQSEGIKSLAFSSDAHLLATGAGDSTVKIWDMNTGETYASLQATLQRFWVHSVCFSPDNQFLAGGTGNNFVIVWNMRTMEEKARLAGHTSSVTSVTFSNDGRFLASGGWDKTIIIWDISHYHVLRRLTGHAAWVNSIAFSPEKNVLASGSSDKTIKLWDVQDGEETCSLRGHSESVTSLVFSPDGSLLASGSQDTRVHLWDMAEKRIFQQLTGHSEAVTSLDFAPDGNLLASGSRDNIVRVWDIHHGKLFRQFSGHTAPIHSVCFSPDGQFLVSGADDNMVRLWKL